MGIEIGCWGFELGILMVWDYGLGFRMGIRIKSGDWIGDLDLDWGFGFGIEDSGLGLRLYWGLGLGIMIGD